MKKSLELTIRDVYGGDGQIRYMDVEVPKLQRKKTTKRTKSDIGVTTESSLDEVTSEKQKVEVQTFRYTNGKPLLRLGGTHGKLWGALEEARRILHTIGNDSFKNKGITKSLQVQPVWVELEPLEDMTIETLPQILNTPGSSMVTQRFDVIPKCKARVDLVFPDALENLIGKLIEQVQSMGILNKRRAIIEKVEEI